jgi:hypothetical protein
MFPRVSYHFRILRGHARDLHKESGNGGTLEPAAHNCSRVSENYTRDQNASTANPCIYTLLAMACNVLCHGFDMTRRRRVEITTRYGAEVPESRWYTRFEVRGTVTFVSRGKTYIGKLNNIGLGGFKFHCENAPPSESIGAIYVKVTGFDRTFTVVVRVAHRAGCEIGALLVIPDPTLLDCLAWLERQSGLPLHSHRQARQSGLLDVVMPEMN